MPFIEDEITKKTYISYTQRRKLAEVQIPSIVDSEPMTLIPRIVSYENGNASMEDNDSIMM